MAWTADIKLINLAERTVSIVATRTDDVTGEVISVRVPKAKIETAGERLAARQEIIDEYLAKVAQNTAIATAIGNLETSLVEHLEANY